MRVYGWHFLAADRRLGYADGRLVRPGVRMRMRYTAGATRGSAPVMCQLGMHASRRAIDALRYAPGPTVCRVLLDGVGDEIEDKVVAEYRTALWVADASRALREFACGVAEGALRRAGGAGDPRSWRAIEVARAFAAGSATPSELGAAEDAAWSAAGAAGSAAGAAWSAAGAAWSAAGAAGSAAWSAAGSAAWSAAGSAAWSAAMIELNDLLERRLLRLHRLGR